jgi:hypothetical protein
MSSPHFDKVKEHLRTNQNEKWGFIVYRCTYDDDKSRECMMKRLRIQLRENLICHDAVDLFPRIDWAVQENSSWDGASPALIKQ